MSSDDNDFVNAKGHARERPPHFPAMQQHISYCYYDCVKHIDVSFNLR